MVGGYRRDPEHPEVLCLLVVHLDLRGLVGEEISDKPLVQVRVFSDDEGL